MNLECSNGFKLECAPQSTNHLLNCRANAADGLPDEVSMCGYPSVPFSSEGLQRASKGETVIHVQTAVGHP